MKKTLLLLIIVVMRFINVNAQLTESFDGGTFPPAGWANIHTTGTNSAALWSSAAAGAFLGELNAIGDPAYINPHSGAGMASFTSYDFIIGDGANLISGPVNLSSGGPYLVKFWMYRDSMYANWDSISVYINTTASTAGASFLGKILRYKLYAPIETGADGWYEYAFSIPAGYNSATNYIIFSAVSGYGNNMFIDDVSVAVEPSSPTNNICSGAVSIDVNNVSGSTINSTTLGATLTLAANSCSGITGTADDDVWFEFTTAAGASSGSITITPVPPVGITDIVAELYATPACTSLGSPVTCANLTTEAVPEIIDLSLLVPNTHYFMRVYSFSNTPVSRGDFKITATGGGTLPVTVTNFSARRSNGVNILNWSTQQELNIDHFVIERSKDGRSFKSMGQVVATGGSNIIRNYSFTDNNPVKGINYYRLRLVDKDNLFKLSNTQSIRNEGIADITLFPNPVKNKLTLDINADKAARGQVVILDLSGKIVYSEILNVWQGNTLVPLAVDGISSGTYLVKIELNDDLVVKKFNKQ